jgi:fluoride exporter
MYAIFLLCAGAAMGIVLRLGLDAVTEQWFGSAFSWSAMGLSLLGSFALGALVGWLAFHTERGWTQPFRLFSVIGIVGGFTAFPVFALDFARLFDSGDIARGAGLMVASVALSLSAVFGGLYLVRSKA